MYTDLVVSLVLARGVGAGLGATDVLKFHHNHVRANSTTMAVDHDIIGYYHRGYIPVVFLLVGFVTSVAATVVSTRLWAMASNDTSYISSRCSYFLDEKLERLGAALA
ncbi:hypothetical protein EJB05_15864, partial [Eragrostis curvula]